MAEPDSGRYYTDLGRGSDYLLRCDDCKRLVTHAAIIKIGKCPKCGTRRFREIVALSLWEWLRIRLGLLNFAHRADFLKEFARGR